MLLKLNLQRFAPAIVFITINFDSHISKVTYRGVEWTASGQSQQTAIVDGSTGVFTVTLDSGYVLDTVTLGSDFDNTTLSAKTDTSFSLLFGNTSGGTITITSKQSSSSTKLIKIKFKDTLTFTSDQIFDITFKSNNQNFTQFLGQYGKGFTLSYNSTAVYDFINGWTTPFNIIEIDPTQINFNAFITAMKDNIDGVELEAGTYKWNDSPSNVLEDTSGSLTGEFSFTSNGKNLSSIGVEDVGSNQVTISYTGVDFNGYALNEVGWTNYAYKTITTTENQYVDYDFYNYAILGNQLVKHGSTPTYKFKHWKKSNVKINEQSTETWLFNSPMTDTSTNKEINITFTSNGETFTKLAIRLNKGIMNYVKSDGTSVGAYEDGWAGNPQYQTITVDTRQANYQELRTFLNSNASIQSSNKYYFKPYTILGLYTITTTLTNCTGASANATKIQENGGLTLTFTANSGYELPTGVSVTNVTSYNWNKSTGVLAISKPTGDVAIEIVAVSALPQLSTPTNVAVTDTTLTFDDVANATSYEVFVDNVSIGTHEIVTGYTISWSGGGKTPSIRVSINDGELIKLAESTGSINNVKTIKFFAEFNEFMVATVKSTTLNLNLSGDGKPSSITAGSIASSEYTLTQDVTDLVISTAPRSTTI